MTSTIKVNNIQNQCGQNIINENSNTITIGASGDTIALASGASQTGFGRAGSVNWQTGSIKTSDFTAANGEGYFVDTSSGAVTATLPSSPTAGDIVAFADYTRTFATNNLTIGRNSQPIGGITENAKLIINGQAATFVYVDGTEGWINVQNVEDSETGQSNYIQATGGTITTCGDFKIHQFTGPGTFIITQSGTPSGSNSLDYLVVAGGGSGHGSSLGGGGAGGFRKAAAGLPTTCMGGDGSYPVTIGAGGAASPGQNQGSNTIFSSITSAGGGAGGNSPPSQNPDLSKGGSGGAIGRDAYLAGRTTSNNGNSPPVSPPQGSNGGVYAYSGPSTLASAGGGGHAGTGANGSPGNNGGAGGAGSPAAPVFGSAPKPFYIANGPANGASACGQFAGGGGGGTYPSGGPAGAGGVGGGGNGGGGPTSTAVNNGTANTGGGGGGNHGPPCGSSGGSGIVLIRYKFQN